MREKTPCHHMGYSFRLTARVVLYAPSYRQDSTYHSLCYTSRGALAGTRNSLMGPPNEGLIQRPITSWTDTALELHITPIKFHSKWLTGTTVAQWCKCPLNVLLIWRPIASWADALPQSYISLHPTPNKFSILVVFLIFIIKVYIFTCRFYSLLHQKVEY